MRQHSSYDRANDLFARADSPLIILGNVSDRPRPEATLPIGRRNRGRSPLWLWWNILSLDAPTVAFVWVLLFARITSVQVSVADLSVLTLAVWVIYVCDRLLDGWSPQSWASLHERHNFCARHRGSLICLVLATTGAILWLAAERLTPLELRAGLLLGGFVAAYMIGVHVGSVAFIRRLPKEVVAGSLFALGTTLPIWSRSPERWSSVWVVFIFFSLLCSLNCLAIECWENHSPCEAWRPPPHPFVLWCNSRINQLAGVLVVCGLAGFFAFAPASASRSAWFAVCLSALLILLLNVWRRNISADGLRVLADAALVIPALIALTGRI
jgi:hypothetical protein